MDINTHLPKIVLGIGVLAVIIAIEKPKNKTYDVGVINPNIATITDQEAKQKAEILYNAMKDLGQEKEMIFATLQGLTNADFKKIFKAFGSRKYNTYSGTSYGAIYSYNLITWLKEELGSEYITLQNNFSI